MHLQKPFKCRSQATIKRIGLPLCCNSTVAGLEQTSSSSPPGSPLHAEIMPAAFIRLPALSMSATSNVTTDVNSGSKQQQQQAAVEKGEGKVPCRELAILHTCDKWEARKSLHGGRICWLQQPELFSTSTSASASLDRSMCLCKRHLCACLITLMYVVCCFSPSLSLSLLNSLLFCCCLS